MNANQATVHRLGRLPLASGRTTNQATPASVTIRPPQPAATSPALRRPVSFQIRASTRNPPSRGRPGSRLNTATKALEMVQAKSNSQPTPAETASRRTQPSSASRALVTGPLTETSALRPGDGAGVVNAVCPPQRLTTTRATAYPLNRATTAWAASWHSTLMARSTAYTRATR